MSETLNPPGPTLLPGQSAPLTVITETDKSGILLIATALALIFALLSIILRLFIRAQFRHKHSGDDVAALVSMGLMVIQTGLVFVEVSYGFGKTGEDVSQSDKVTWQKYSYTSDIFYILTLWSTKLSIVLLFLRVSPDSRHAVVSHVFIWASAVLVPVSILIVCLRCQITDPWLFVGVQCPGLYARWQAVASFDISSEVTLFLMSIYLVHGLQQQLGKKMVVIFAFGLRLPIIAAAALHLHYLQVELGGSDPSLQGVLAKLCAEVELCYAVIATTIPCLRPFMFALNTHYGGPGHTTASPVQSRKQPDEYNISLGALSNRSKLVETDQSNQSLPATRWDEAEYKVNVAVGDHESVTSNDSRRMIISKNTEWVVDYENRS